MYFIIHSYICTLLLTLVHFVILHSEVENEEHVKQHVQSAKNGTVTKTPRSG